MKTFVVEWGGDVFEVLGIVKEGRSEPLMRMDTGSSTRLRCCCFGNMAFQL